METLKSRFQTRIRNQISNILIFGSLILCAGGGLLLGCVLGVLGAERIPDSGLSPVLKLTTTVLSTTFGFIGGTLLGLFISPLVLRFAFFAKPLTTWKGVRVFKAADSDLPGGLANVFVSGFSSGFGPFRPIIFASEGALNSLSPSALEAVFAHECAHLKRNHLLVRYVKATGTFLLSSLLVTTTLIGASMSGYAQPSGWIPPLAAIVPALLTWMTVKRSLWTQELEADEVAINDFSTSPSALLEALEKLQSEIERRAPLHSPHPLVIHRMEVLRSLSTGNEEPRTLPSSESRIAA